MCQTLVRVGLVSGGFCQSKSTDDIVVCLALSYFLLLFFESESGPSPNPGPSPGYAVCLHQVQARIGKRL